MTEWHNLKTSILQQDDKSKEVSTQNFEKVEVLMKDGKIVKRLKAISTQANLSFITEFLETWPSSIIYTYTNIQMCSDWRTKSPLVSVQNKHFYLLFSMNKLNYSKGKKNEKSRDTVQQI